MWHVDYSVLLSVVGERIFLDESALPLSETENPERPQGGGADLRSANSTANSQLSGTSSPSFPLSL